MKTHMHARYRILARGMPLTLLHIGPDHTEVVVEQGAQPAASLELALGAHKTSAQFFRHNPPTPGELENAIQWVEDEVSRARALVAGHPALWTTDTWVQDMAQLAGVSGTVLSIETVEQLFDLLASLSQGRPVASAGIPDTPAFAATLLVLREFMHHLGFTEIRWVV